MKTRYIAVLIIALILIGFAPAGAGASVEEMVFDGQNAYGRWDSSLWNWDVSVDGNRVTAKPWGGVYVRFVGGNGIDVSNIEYLNIQLQSTEPVLVSLVCDCGNQPVFETTGNVHLPPSQLIAAGTQKIHGVMIQSTFKSHKYTLSSVRLILKNPLIEPTSQPTATSTPTRERPTQTPQPPPATGTLQPTATSTPTRERSNCTGLTHEAESGKIFGNFLTYQNGVEAGPRSSEAMSADHRIDFCIRVEQEGKYQISGRVRAKDSSSNSMYVAVNDLVLLWHMTTSSSYIDQRVSNSGSVNGNNRPVTVFLARGVHDISFYHRESEVQFDRFEVVPADNPIATPQPTATPNQPRPDVSINGMIHPNTQIDYSNAGLSDGIPDYPNTIVVNGTSQRAIEEAIAKAKPYTKIVLPPGEYRIGTLNITKSNIALVGGGNACGETILKFGANDTGIKVGFEQSPSTSFRLTATANRNSKMIRVSSASSFSVGDYILIRQNDDSNLFRADLSRNYGKDGDWVLGNGHQINKVVSKSGDTLILEGGLNLDYKTSLDARVGKIHNMLTGVGIENLTIERTVDSPAEKQSANLFFGYTANSWVRGVHSIKSVRAHIYFYRSYKGEVRGNYLDASYDNGDGGHGYGVRLQGGATDILVENNIARLMRHSYIAQIGANGNVFGYNYSADPFGEGWGEIYTDLSVHGGFGHSNLFEGNQAQMAKIDNIHASNSGNLFFRNRLEQDIDNYTYRSQLLPKGATTPHIWVHENQYYNAFLANEIGFPGADRATQTLGFPNGNLRENFTVCKYVNSSDGERGCGRTRSTTVNHGTYDYLQDQTTWDRSISQRSFPASVYLNSRPAFWANSAWPSFGPDTLSLSESQKEIPAKTRFVDANNGRSSYCYLDE